MAKTLYEGYRIGKNGGERWVGTIEKRRPANRQPDPQRDPDSKPAKLPTGGSAISSPSKAS